MNRTITATAIAALLGIAIASPAAAIDCEDGEGCATMSTEQAARVAARWICPALRAEARLDRYAVEGKRLSRKARAAATRTSSALYDLGAELTEGWTASGYWPNPESGDTADAIADMAMEDADWLAENVTRTYVWDGFELFDLGDDVAQLWADLGVAPAC